MAKNAFKTFTAHAPCHVSPTVRNNHIFGMPDRSGSNFDGSIWIWGQRF